MVEVTGMTPERFGMSNRGTLRVKEWTSGQKAPDLSPLV